jgi:hypothetical protein
MSYTAHFINGPRHGDISIIPERSSQIIVALNNDGLDMWSCRTQQFPTSPLKTGTYLCHSGIPQLRNSPNRIDELIYVWDGKR